MFDFLTGFIDILTSIFSAIQSVFDFVSGLLSQIFEYLFHYFGYWSYVVDLIPDTVYIIIGPILTLAVAAAIFRAVAWVKHMIPFN